MRSTQRARKEYENGFVLRLPYGSASYSAVLLQGGLFLRLRLLLRRLLLLLLLEHLLNVGAAVGHCSIFSASATLDVAFFLRLRLSVLPPPL